MERHRLRTSRKTMRKDMSFRLAKETDGSTSEKPSKSRIRQFFSKKTNVALVTLTFSLLTLLTVVLALVKVPDLIYQSTPTNPADYAVIPHNFPDPSFLQDWRTGNFYAFSTRHTNTHVQVAVGKTISSWTLKQNYDALPNPGAWVATRLNDSQVWAPSVTATLSGDYVMFYSALHKDHPRRHCIGVATSSNIIGPYNPLPDPLVCDLEDGGVIDPSYFQDPGTNTSYLIYKQDGNALGSGGACGNGNWPNTPTTLMAIELSPKNLTTTIGKSFQLLANIRADGPNIESPMLYYYEYRDPNSTRFTRSYHLLYNSGCFYDSSYRIQHIVCEIPSETAFSTDGIRGCFWQTYRSKAAACLGNCTKSMAGTILSSETNIDVGTVNVANTGSSDSGNSFTQSDGTTIRLMAPGGPALAPPPLPYTQSLTSTSTNLISFPTTTTKSKNTDCNLNTQYLAFHADTNMAYFSDPIPKTQPRVRAMFIAELLYDPISMDVRVVGLVKPGS